VPGGRVDKSNIERRLFTHLVTLLVFSGQFGRGAIARTPHWTAHAMSYGRLSVLRGRFGCKIRIR